jgi:hypothetical protein
VTSTSGSYSALSCWERGGWREEGGWEEGGRRTGGWDAFLHGLWVRVWGNNSAFFEIPPFERYLTLQHWRVMVRAGETRRMGSYITGLEAVTIDFHLFPSAIPTPFYAGPFRVKCLTFQLFGTTQYRQTSSPVLQTGIYKWCSNIKPQKYWYILRRYIFKCVFFLNTQNMSDNTESERWKRTEWGRVLRVIAVGVVRSKHPCISILFPTKPKTSEQDTTLSA